MVYVALSEKDPVYLAKPRVCCTSHSYNTELCSSMILLLSYEKQ